jgi:hypothetical protein
VKAKDLLKILEENPEYEIEVSIDAFDITSIGEDRVFGNSMTEAQKEDATKTITLLFENCDTNFGVVVATEPK